MKKLLQFFFISMVIFNCSPTMGQINLTDIKFWVGSGSDTALLIIDFHDASWDTSYVWGYLHDGTATGKEMLTDVAAADPNLIIDISGGFLSDLTYGLHAGIGGTNGFYWSTWSGTSLDDFFTNNGLDTPLSEGNWFGCAFTDFSPAIPPGNPIPAFDPFFFTAKDVDFWIGEGHDTTLLVIDFDGLSPSQTSYAWGYLHNGQVTPTQIIQIITNTDPQLFSSIDDGVIHLITYLTHSGVEGDPDFWRIWKATNLGNWQLLPDLKHIFGNGDILGLSYSGDHPVLRPGYPVAASSMISTSPIQMGGHISVFPNPVYETLHVSLSDDLLQSAVLQLTDIHGKILQEERVSSSTSQLSVRHLPAGTYFVSILGNNFKQARSFIKN